MCGIPRGPVAAVLALIPLERALGTVGRDVISQFLPVVQGGVSTAEELSEQPGKRTTDPRHRPGDAAYQRVLRSRDPHVLERARITPWPFHAYHAGRQASVSADGKVLAGGLEPRALRFVRKCAGLPNEEILANRERVRKNEPFLEMEPLP